MRADTLFWIASQSKPITAAALMMLVDEGKVDLADPVEKYLPEFKGQMVAKEKDSEHVLLGKPAHPITVREILSHTSGLPFASPMEEPTLDLLPLRVAVRSYSMVPLQFAPGSKYLLIWMVQHAGYPGPDGGKVFPAFTKAALEAFGRQR